MIDLVIFITLLVIAIKAYRTIKENSNIFDEFNQSKILSALVLLYPLGPLLLLLGEAMFPRILLFVIVAACYLPALIIANRQNKAFECAGTDRVTAAKSGVSYASVGALAGLIYLSVVVVLSIAFTTYAAS